MNVQHPLRKKAAKIIFVGRPRADRSIGEDKANLNCLVLIRVDPCKSAAKLRFKIDTAQASHLSRIAGEMSWLPLTAQGSEAHVSKPRSPGAPVSPRTLHIVDSGLGPGVPIAVIAEPAAQFLW